MKIVIIVTAGLVAMLSVAAAAGDTQEAVCASLQGMPFEPCFHLEKTDDRSFRGSLSGLGFA